MSVSSSRFYYIGPSVLPPTLLQNYQKHTGNKAGAQNLSPVRGASGILGGLISRGYEGAKRLWSVVANTKELFEYTRYSRQLKQRFDESKAPYEIHRYVYNAKGRDHLPSPRTLARQEGGPVSIIREANQAYDYSGFTFEFFKQHLGFVLPQPMIQVVNYNDNPLFLGFGNAFFAPLQFGLQMMVYGTGDDRFFKSFTSDLTVIAHELSHAFTNNLFPGKFTHPGQTGALNEHFSDVIAKCVEAKYRGWNDQVGNWKIGADLMVNPDFALRSMSFPGTAYDDPLLGKDEQVAHMVDFMVTDQDDGGVHLNNGIMNRVFALFCERVKGPIYELPLQIWVSAMQSVKANPSFKDFGMALLDAASEVKLEEPMLEVLKETGVLEYEVVDGEVKRIEPLANEGVEIAVESDDDEDQRVA